MVMTYAIVDLKSKDTVRRVGALPVQQTLPDGGLAQFDQVGDERPEHAPVYRLVAVEEATPRPDYPVVEVASEREFKDGKEVITKTYAPDLSAFTAAIEDHIEATARARQYSSAVSCASYLSDPNPAWSAEAQAFIAWRSSVWAKVFEMLGAVQGGSKAVPTIPDMIAELPAMEWPQG